jgi:hypothetical protein
VAIDVFTWTEPITFVSLDAQFPGVLALPHNYYLQDVYSKEFVALAKTKLYTNNRFVHLPLRAVL